MLVFSIQCQSCFQFCDRMEGWGKRGIEWVGVGLSGIEFGCLLIAKPRFNCLKKHILLVAGCVCSVYRATMHLDRDKTFDSALCGFQCLRKQPKKVVRVAMEMYPEGCLVKCFFVLEIHSELCICRITAC